VNKWTLFSYSTAYIIQFAGVTHLPEVQRIDLKAAFQQLQEERERQEATTAATGAAGVTAVPSSAADTAPATGMSAEEVAQHTLCLVLATDGVWDNWLYEDVNKFVMDPR
jgi:hypothetical protein